MLRNGKGSKKVGGGCKIEIVFAESESEVEIGQFGREGQKQRSFGVKLTGEGEGAVKLKLSSLIPNL